jgi:ATP-dependent Lon protease
LAFATFDHLFPFRIRWSQRITPRVEGKTPAHARHPAPQKVRFNQLWKRYEIAPLDESRGQDEEAIALSRAVLEALFAARNVGQISFVYEQFRISSVYDRLQENKEPGTLADAVAAILSCDVRQKQDLLETGDVVSRLQKILALMKTDQQAA